MNVQNSNVIEKLIDTIEESLDYYQYNCGFDDYYHTIKEKLDNLKEELGKNETR